MKPWALGVLIFTAAELNEKFALRMISIFLEISKKDNFVIKPVGPPPIIPVAARTEVHWNLQFPFRQILPGFSLWSTRVP